MADNMPWDVFTRRLIASSGDGWDPETAAVGYYTRDRGMPLDNLSNTMRVFLGTRMECAQCHDDPFGTTERHDFYELAAFTHGQEPVRQDLMQPLWNELRATTDAREQRGIPHRPDPLGPDLRHVARRRRFRPHRVASGLPIPRRRTRRCRRGPHAIRENRAHVR